MRPPSGWASVVLVGLMMLTVAWSIQAAEYAPGLEILTPIVVLGVAAGTLLGTQRWLPATLAHGWSVLGGVVATAFLGTAALAEYAGSQALLGLDRLDRVAIVRDWYLAWITAAQSGAQMGEALVQFAFVLTMAMLMWLLAYICTWFVVRYVSWWGAVLPSGFALLFNLQQAPPERLTGLAFFVVCALILAERTHLALQVHRWEREHIGFSPGIGVDFLRDGLVVALVVVAAAWMAPQEVSSQPLRQVLGDALSGAPNRLEQRLSRVFPGPSFPTQGGGTSFGTTMPLGGSVSLGQQAIFEARVDGAETAPRYWRMAVFDRYDGAGWLRSPGDEIAGQGLDLGWAGASARTVPVTQTIRVFQNGAEQLFALPQPDGFDRPVRAETGAAGPVDMRTVWSQTPLGVGDTYRATSQQTIADVAALRADRTGDPAWVAETYLHLPDGVPARVRELAAQITSSAESRFDAAAALEAFLRSEYAYSEEINVPPADRDRVDWFLFDERRGYCDYYSSAFVVMARSVGIPARLAAGYSAGDYIAETASFRQHEFDAHTWPEVYFPTFGWIEFEPTAGDARIDRPDPAGGVEPPEEEMAPDPDERDDMLPERDIPQELEAPVTDPGATAVGESGIPRLLYGLLTAVAVTSVSLAAAYWAWQRPLRGLSAAEGAFARLTRVAAWLGLAPRPADTPAEFGRRLSGAIPQRRADIAAIVDAYVRERFGRRASGDRAVALTGAWARVRRELPNALRRAGTKRMRDR